MLREMRIATGFALLLAAPAYAAPVSPFGISAGQSLKTLDVYEKQRGMAILNNPPKPNDLFFLYSVKAYDSTGVCEIRAHTKSLRDEFGTSTRGKMRQIADALSSLYGPPSRSVDDCGGATCKPEFWAMHIQRGARRYAHLWRRDELLATNLNTIVVIAEAGDSGDLRATLIYEFKDNEAACEAAARALDASAL